MDGSLPTNVAEAALRDLLNDGHDELLVKDFDFLVSVGTNRDTIFLFLQFDTTALKNIVDLLVLPQLRTLWHVNIDHVPTKKER